MSVPSGCGFDIPNVSQLGAGPILAAVNNYLGFLPVAWAFEDLQKGAAIVASVFAVLAGLIYVRTRGPSRLSQFILKSGIWTLALNRE